MKKLLISFFLFCLFSIAFAIDINNLNYYGWVNDFAGIIDNVSKEKINLIIDELERKTGAEIAVVTLTSLEDENIEDFANRLFEKWGIGKKGKNNGVLILVAFKEKKIRIETGYGIEGIIPDAKAGRIIREIMAPLFQEGKFGEGILNAVYMISQEIAKDAGVQLNVEKRNIIYRNNKLKISDIITFLVFIIFVLPVIIRNPWLLLLFLSSGSGRRYRYYSGGGFHGGGGGFGGFGGGSSGGGGATGGW
jgi:uncharacterized protein